jgi:hypothetical protein
MKNLLQYTLILWMAASLLHPELVQPAAAAPQQDICNMAFEAVSTPLNDLAGEEYLRMDGTATGAYGGLYPQGSNIRPPAHEAAGRRIANQVVPLDESGNPDPYQGRIVMISVGMSNTAMEFLTFRQISQSDPRVNPRLSLVNGAQPGQTSEAWIDPHAPAWQEVDNRLQQAGLTPLQVQVAWLKQTQTGYGPFPDKARALQAQLKAIVRNLQARYPNMRLVYLSSRTRSYTYWNGLSPEPSAFETGFAVKWLIQAQIDGDPELNYDPRTAAVVAPYLSWGPYLWADGLNMRSDGLTWAPEDLLRDCTHPSDQGREKVAGLLMDFFINDSSTTWFLRTRSIYLPRLLHWD